MVELATLELVGKLIHAPYWQCLGVPDTDKEVQREMDDWFLSMDEAERVQFLKDNMRERRYYDGAIDGKEDAAFLSALRLPQGHGPVRNRSRGYGVLQAFRYHTSSPWLTVTDAQSSG